MDLGLFLSPQQPPGVAPADIVRQHLDQVAVAREAGFRTVLAGQHFLSEPFQMLQSIPFLARLAADSGAMRLGTGILLLALLNPVEAAENLATLAALADGEVIAGVGIGYRAQENAAFGVERGRAQVFERKLDVLRRLLAGEAVTAAGPGYRLTDARVLHAPARPPRIWIAANSDRAVRRAARLGDAWLLNPHTRLDELERQVALFAQERAAAGLPAVRGLPIIKEVCVAADDERALARARPHLASKYDAYVAWGQSEVLPPTDTLRREFAQLTAGGRFIIGSPQTCVRLLQEHGRRLGVDEVLCRVSWPGMPHAEAMDSLRLLAGEVLPALG